MPHTMNMPSSANMEIDGNPVKVSLIAPYMTGKDTEETGKETKDRRTSPPNESKPIKRKVEGTAEAEPRRRGVPAMEKRAPPRRDRRDSPSTYSNERDDRSEVIAYIHRLTFIHTYIHTIF